MKQLLSDLRTGERAVVKHVNGHGAFRKRILEMGFLEGKVIQAVRNAPLKDPVYYHIMGYNVSLRRKDAALIEIRPLTAEEEAAEEARYTEEPLKQSPTTNHLSPTTSEQGAYNGGKHTPHKKLRVALVGNPNSGKTSLFNLASGAHERVGNYSGVTVDAKEGYFKHGDYRIEIVDLPGSYSLSPYSPEELYIRRYLTDPETRPDVVIDVIDSCNLERNLYLAMQIKEMGLKMVIALNMYDEFERSGSHLDREQLSTLLRTPMVPTVCRSGIGINQLFDEVLALAEQSGKEQQPDGSELRIPYGTMLTPSIETVAEKVSAHLPLTQELPAYYIAVKLMEQDREMVEQVRKQPKGEFILQAVRFEIDRIAKQMGETAIETLITDHRYGYIAGALRETYRPRHSKATTTSERVDRVLISRIWGFPIFILFLVVMFQSTFTLGSYPQEWIENGVTWLGDLVKSFMPTGPLRDLLVDGVLGGVGGVIVFLPNILILYFFISIMEDTGYMSRAAFIMDKFMHGMGLHGKSFIPLIMGFGCNVPAIMASRTIESPQSRLVTVLITPLMSCNARLPVYLLLAGAFFPHHAGLVLMGLYCFGILMAVVLARIFRKRFFRQEDVPFVMELPPYRIPTYKAVLIHMWEKSKEYLKKMGTIILFASILIWFLGYYPRHKQAEQMMAQAERIEDDAQAQELRLEANQLQQHNSYLGRMGRGIEPIMRPLGFDWKMSIAILSGLPAKEVVVSTLGVIYTGDSEESTEGLTERLIADKGHDGKGGFTPLVALSFMLFVLLYFPCIATIVAISKETGRAKWGLFTVVYTCLLAWVSSFLLFQIGSALGF